MYTYRAKYRSNYDGDTIRFDIDLGFGVILSNQIVRLYGVNTPELRGDEKELGKKVRDEVKELLSKANTITLRTYKDKKGKYGRWLAEVNYDGEDLTKLLIAQGYKHTY